MTALDNLLVRLDACEEAREWAKTQPDLATAWKNCRRADWMLWLLDELGHEDPKNYHLIACCRGIPSTIADDPCSAGVGDEVSASPGARAFTLGNPRPPSSRNPTPLAG